MSDVQIGAIVTDGFGFGVLALATHPGLASVGKLSLLGLGVNLVACVVLLPALLAHAELPASPGGFDRSGPCGAGGVTGPVPLPPSLPSSEAPLLYVGADPVPAADTIPYPGPAPLPVTNPCPVMSTGSSGSGSCVSTFAACVGGGGGSGLGAFVGAFSLSTGAGGGGASGSGAGVGSGGFSSGLGFSSSSGGRAISYSTWLSSPMALRTSKSGITASTDAWDVRANTRPIPIPVCPA